MSSIEITFVFLIITSAVLSASINNIKPIISLQEIEKKSGKTIEILHDGNKDLDIILDEKKLEGRKLELNCRAPYPIVWIYKGEGVPDLQVTTGVNTIHGVLSEFTEFTATGTIGFSRNISEIDTGNYTCHNLQDIEIFTSYYIYISGDKLFIQTKEQTVIYTEDDTILRIPCSVTHPDVKLSIQKLENGEPAFPLNESLSFDPKSCCVINVSNFSDVEGTYLCNAVFEGNNSSEKINVIKHNAVFACTNGPCRNCTLEMCGENTSCKIFNGKSKCSCLPGYIGNPYHGCSDLKESLDCSRACGTNTICDHNQVFKQIRCHCQPGFYGDPYYSCVKS